MGKFIQVNVRKLTLEIENLAFYSGMCHHTHSNKYVDFLRI